MRVVWLLTALVPLGCGGGLERATVTGTVTLDGQPVIAGTIRFVPEDGLGPSAGSVIADGTYHIAVEQGVPVGLCRVEIHSLGKSGRVLPHPVFADQVWEETVEMVPTVYNDASELRCQIRPGLNTHDFALRP
jgi:hypothetical protein